MDEPLLFISAGDPSGDNAASHAVASLQSETPGLRLFGLGGPRLRALGQVQLADGPQLAVLGFWEVARRYRFFRRLFHHCVNEITRRRPSAVLLVDYPGFNLRLARKIKPLGIPIVYYISPQVWAWGKGRLRQIQKYIDRMLVILPFEETYYRDHGVNVDFVGHYLMDDIPSEYIATDPPGNRQIALLPGSRRQEIEQMLPPMLQTARQMNRTYGSTAVVAGMKGVFDYEELAACHRDSGITVSYDDSRKLIHESDLVLTASGTATLETGIIGRPMVVVYKTGVITYCIARRFVTLDKIALVNLVLGERVVPELIQRQATSTGMASQLERYWTDDSHRKFVQGKLARIPSLLGGPGASERAAGAVSKYL